jgi:hypothetical protein
MPYALARRSHRHEEDIVNDPLPQLVVAQFQERYYPRARPVPNIVPINEELYTPTRKGGSGVTVFFAPSNIRSAWQVPDALSRWDTKGFPETLALLKRIERATPGVRIDVGLKLPHAECLARRRHSHVSIDEMVTGSYHLSSLESLSQGVPTFAFLDRRTQVTLAEITGTGEHPWMDFRLEEAEIPLRRLLEDAELREEVGRYSRQWMEQYWDDVAMVRHFVRAYEDLLERPGVFQKMRFDPSDGKAMWFGRGMDDASWEARRTRHVQCGIWRTIRAGLGVRRREL